METLLNGIVAGGLTRAGLFFDAFKGPVLLVLGLLVFGLVVALVQDNF